MDPDDLIFFLFCNEWGLLDKIDEDVEVVEDDLIPYLSSTEDSIFQRFFLKCVQGEDTERLSGFIAVPQTEIARRT
jgi:hypothetical protein